MVSYISGSLPQGLPAAMCMFAYEGVCDGSNTLEHESERFQMDGIGTIEDMKR